MKNLFIFASVLLTIFLYTAVTDRIEDKNIGLTPDYLYLNKLVTANLLGVLLFSGASVFKLFDRNTVSDRNLKLRSFKSNNSNPSNVFKVTTRSLMHPAHFRQLLSKEGMRLQITDRCKGLSRSVICLDNGESFLLSVIERVFRSIRLTNPAPIQRVQGITLLS
jgi:hypothetical protein